VRPAHIVVLGGGISGLAAAYVLAQARRGGAPMAEYLVEASPGLGGALCTERVEGCLVEAGADSFLTEKPEAIQLCREVGLGEQLVGSNDAERRTLILHRGRLVPLPEGFEFLVPTRLAAVAATPLLSWRDKLALATEIFRRPRAQQEDESVAAFIERHFSRGLLENVVDPLLSAVYGGDARELSVATVLPRLVEIEREWGSLVRGLRHAAARRQQAPGTRPPLFTTLRDGVSTLADTLRSRVEATRLRLERRAVELTVQPGGKAYRVRLDSGEAIEAEAVILALPAYESARLLRPADAPLAYSLAAIPYSSSVIVALGYDERALPALPRGFGFLVPEKEKRRLLACTFMNHKFPGRVAPGQVLLRCFLGGMRDEGVLELADTEVLALVGQELRDILGITTAPAFARVYRWRKALAQYTVGHGARVATVQQRLAAHHGLFLCGNAYQGIGVPDCIRSGRAAAEECLRYLRSAAV